MSVLYKMPIDLYRDGDHYTLNADLPGIDPSSVDLDVDGQYLTIRAERVAPSTEGLNWLARENRSGSFVRRLTLGEGQRGSGGRCPGIMPAGQVGALDPAGGGEAFPDVSAAVWRYPDGL